MSIGARNSGLRLGDTLKLANADEVRQRLLSAFESQEIMVDAAGVRDVDFAGVQVLVAAAKSAQARGRTFRLVGAWDGALPGALADAGLRPDDLEWLAPAGAAR